MKPPKKAPNKPPKYATALVPFKQIGDAFAAVCASGRPERGLDDVDVTWAEGKEPDILGWLKAQGKLSSGGAGNPMTVSSPVASQTAGSASFRPPQKPSDVSPFSSFPESFVSLSS